MGQNYYRFKRKALIVLAGAVFCIVAPLRCYFSFAVAVGDSMRPTLNSGDLLLVYRRNYANSAPRRGDILLAQVGRDLVVKRVVGLPGEEVEVKEGALYIDETLIPEYHTLTNGVQFDIGKGKLFAGRFATLGDNRSLLPGEAFHPIISRDQIIGKVIFSMPFSRLRAKH